MCSCGSELAILLASIQREAQVPPDQSRFDGPGRPDLSRSPEGRIGVHISSVGWIARLAARLGSGWRVAP
jgi:hypothetical protein